MLQVLAAKNDCPGVHNTKVSDVFFEGKKMVFLFDYGDDWFFDIICTAVRESESNHRDKKKLSEKGERPIQYPEFDEDEWN